MTDRSKQIPDIRPISAYSVGDDLIILQDTSEGKTTIITVANLFGNSFANIVVSSANLHISSHNLKITKSNTPATSSEETAGRTVWFDNSYAYFAIANNVIKRVALEAF